jgi:hypothetical protein
MIFVSAKNNAGEDKGKNIYLFADLRIYGRGMSGISK